MRAQGTPKMFSQCLNPWKLPAWFSAPGQVCRETLSEASASSQSRRRTPPEMLTPLPTVQFGPSFYRGGTRGRLVGEADTLRGNRWKAGGLGAGGGGGGRAAGAGEESRAENTSEAKGKRRQEKRNWAHHHKRPPSDTNGGFPEDEAKNRASLG